MYIALIDEHHEEISGTRRSVAETYFEMVYIPDKGICMVNRTPLKWTAFEKGKDMVPLNVFCRIGYVIGLGFYKDGNDPVPVMQFAIDASVPYVHCDSTFLIDKWRLCFQMHPTGSPLPAAVPKRKSGLWSLFKRDLPLFKRRSAHPMRQ